MKLDKNQKTMIAFTALILVCLGSFIGIRALNGSVQEPSTTQPTVITTAPTTIPTTVPTTAPTTTAPTTTAPTTIPTTVPTTQITIQNNITTTVPTTVPTTAPTTAPTTTKKPVVQQNPQDLINNAGVFDKGFLSYMYNPDGNFYYTYEDPWQRALGYTEFYDIGAPFLAIYFDTIRCKFEYDNRDWMIQFWKGQYGYVFLGAEIGVYNKTKDREVEFYDCASNDDSLFMSMTCYRNGEEIFTRDYAKYWWCTGFVPGRLESFSDRSELVVKCRITMKDYKMLVAFTGALKENGYNLGEEFTTSGLDVYFTWE